MPLIAALNTKTGKTFVANGVVIFNNGPANFPKIHPSVSPDIIIFSICALFNFISAYILFSIAFLNFVVCLCVRNNS